MIVNKVVEEYIRKKSQTDNQLLREIEEFALTNNVPIIEPEVRNFLGMIVKIKKPCKILEIGTAIGYSSIIMKMASKDSKITTIEINEDSFSEAKLNIEKFGFEKDIHCILGDANEVIELLEDEYDLIFIDAAKGQYINFFEKTIDKLKVNGVLVSDNILFRGMVAEEKYKTTRHRKITIVKRLDEYIDLLINDKRLSSSIVPIDDGMMITYRNE